MNSVRHLFNAIKSSRNSGIRQFSSTAICRGGGHGPYAYRTTQGIENSKYSRAADVAGAFFWWWIFWHFMTDYGHVLGEFPFPDPSKWTDQELGIPPK